MTNMKSLNFGLKIKYFYSQTAYGGGCGLSGGLVMIKYECLKVILSKNFDPYFCLLDRKKWLGKKLE